MLRGIRGIALVVVMVMVTGVWGAEPLGVHYRLSEPGQVSLAVYERDTGVMLRTLLSGEPQEAGAHSVAWDGLDRLGNPVVPGTYEWKLLQTPGLKSEYLLTLGTNPGTAPYDTWPGNHNGIHGVAVDGDNLYIAASGAEVSPMLIVTSLDGTERRHTAGQAEAWQGAIRLISGGEFYYFLQGNGRLGIRRTDGEWVGHHAFKDLVWPEDEPKNVGQRMDIALDVAGERHQFAVSYRDHDTIRWVDVGTLDPQRRADVAFLDSVTVPDPRGIAFDQEGRLLVTSESRLLRLSRENQVPEVLAEDLVAPERVDVCAATGDIFVVDGGASQQIKRFGSDGALRKTYGREGGRKQGLYVATDFLGVSDIAADGKGGFVICEMGTAPRRVTHFNASGEVVNEWYGGQQFFQHANPDPADPTSVWISSHWGWVVQVKMDYEARSWKVFATYRVQGMANGMMPGHHSHVGWEIRRHNGVAYLTRDGLPYLLRVDEENHALIPVMASGNQITHYWSAQPEFIQQLLENDRQSPYKSYLWTDRNGDGLVQPEEVELSRWSAWWSGWSMDRDFNILGASATEVFRIPVTGWSADGLPTYAWGEPEKILDAPAGVVQLAGYGADFGGLYRHEDGSHFGLFNDRTETHGYAWTGDMFKKTGLIRWGADGVPLWVVGRHATERANPPGQTHNPIEIMGVVHDSVVIGERVVQPAVAWDMDGLYVGRFFDNRADDGLPNALYTWWRPIGGGEGYSEGYINYDMLVGGAIHALPDGDVLWFAPGWNNTMVYRVTGWDGWQRQTGRVEVREKPVHATAQGSGLLGQYFGNQDLSGKPALVRLDAQLAFDWKNESPDPERPAAGSMDLDDLRDANTREDPLLADLVGELTDELLGDERDPDPLRPDSFSIRWEGQVEAKFTEPFVFSTYSKDGVRVWLNGDLIIDRWEEWDGRMNFQYTKNLRFTRTESEPVALVAGQKYDLKVEFYHGGEVKGNRESRFFLNWESPTLAREHIPAAYLYPAEGRL